MEIDFHKIKIMPININNVWKLEQNIFCDIDASSDIIISNSPDKYGTRIEELFDEGLLYLSSEYLVIDMGWYPEMDIPDGCYCCYVIYSPTGDSDGFDWNDGVVFEYKTRDRYELAEIINRIINEYLDCELLKINKQTCPVYNLVLNVKDLKLAGEPDSNYDCFMEEGLLQIDRFYSHDYYDNYTEI